MRIGIIGLGSIASAVCTSLARAGHPLTVSQRSVARARDLSARFSGVTVAENQTVLDQSDVVFLGTTAEQAPEVLRDLRFRDDHQVISFMVGIAWDDLGALVTPARTVATMIPFPSVAEGGSPILVHPQSDMIDALFGKTDTVLSLPDAASLNDFLAAQTVLSPIVQMLATAAHWLGDRTGASAQSEQFLRLLVGGSIMARPLTDENVLRDLISALNTPGGLNRTLRELMEAHGTFDKTRDGLDLLAKRLNSEA
jgi:pyrroline-5-carboxylate reductase